MNDFFVTDGKKITIRDWTDMDVTDVRVNPKGNTEDEVVKRTGKKKTHLIPGVYLLSSIYMYHMFVQSLYGSTFKYIENNTNQT